MRPGPAGDARRSRGPAARADRRHARRPISSRHRAVPRPRALGARQLFTLRGVGRPARGRRGRRRPALQSTTFVDHDLHCRVPIGRQTCVVDRRPLANVELDCVNELVSK